MSLTVRHKAGDLLKAVDRLNIVLKNASSHAITEADTRLRFLIANTLNASRDILDESLDKVDVQFKNNVDYIMSAVRAIEERFYDQITDFNNRLTHAAQAVRSNKPLLLSIEPSCIIRTSNAGNAVFKLVGHFPTIGTPGLKPSLMLNGHQAILIKPLQGECSFSIPYQALFARNSDVCVAHVEIPCENVLYRRDVYKYKLLIGIIPSSPGIIVVEHTKSVNKREINPTPKSNHFHLISREDLGKKDQNQLCRVQATQGWKVLRGSHQLQIHHNKGDTSLQLVEENDAEVVYRAVTYYRKKSKRACGELRFTLSCTEYRESDALEPPTKTPVHLEWNTSQQFDYSPKTWKVIFTPFDQSFSREFLGPSTDDPFINLTFEGQGLRISTKDPAKIKRLQIAASLPEDFAKEKEEPQQNPVPPFSSIARYGAVFALGVGASRFISKL